MNPTPPPICAVIVTYNPGAELEQNVRALLPQVSKVIAVDNASASPGHQRVAQLASLPGVEIIWNGSNLGIAAALNAGIERASQSGFTWVATFDQDSRAPAGFFTLMWEAYVACPFRHRVAVIGPHYTLEIRARTESLATPQNSVLYKEVLTTMTSGNLLNVDLFFRCGRFDESLFIDYVDHEFCLRVQKLGFRVIEAVRATLAHRLGELTAVRAFGRGFTPTHHSALRRYYNTRNRLRICARFLFLHPGWVLTDLVGLGKETIKLVLFERDRKNKLLKIARGAADALRGRSGPYAD